MMSKGSPEPTASSERRPLVSPSHRIRTPVRALNRAGGLENRMPVSGLGEKFPDLPSYRSSSSFRREDRERSNNLSGNRLQATVTHCFRVLEERDTQPG